MNTLVFLAAARAAVTSAAALREISGGSGAVGPRKHSITIPQ